MSQADTFERSCVHWSEEKRSGMDAFYTLATADYRHLAQAMDWPAFLARHASGGDRPLNVLDVACGSGKFPAALVDHGGLQNAALPPIRIALLDPSAFSIAEARQSLRPPFAPGEEFETTLQAFQPPRQYDIVWATHALYAIPAQHMAAALKVFLSAISGAGVIAHAARAAHYITFYDHFLQDFRAGTGEPYSSAEDILDALTSLGATPQVIDVDYTQTSADRSAVEGYLQRCVFDDTVSLDDLLNAPNTGAYLSRCREGDTWSFRQTVKLILL